MTQVINGDHVGIAERQATGVDHQGFWRVLGRFAGTLAEPDASDDVLDQFAADMCRILGVAGIGLMVADDEGGLRSVSSSDETVHHLEDLQIALAEGPAPMAHDGGQIVLGDDLGGDPRFPRFGRLACEAGVASIHSFPLCEDDQAVGALNLYSERPASLTADQVEVGLAFALVITCHLLHTRDVEQQELLAGQLQQALDSRVVIEQAKGLLVAHLRISPQDAFEVLRGYARRNQIAIRSVAHGLLNGDVEGKDLLRR